MGGNRLSLEAAQELMLRAICPLKPVSVPLRNALGCVLAEQITAPISHPPFPRSPYDGYALRSEDSKGASEDDPVVLEVVGRSYAGAPADVSITSGQAVRIMTGGVIPDGADCVIMQEKTDCGEKTVKVFAELSPYANYCESGEDFHAGDILLTEGILISAAEYAVLTSAGYDSIKVFPKPRVSVVATGDELQSVGEKLRPGHIYNSNSAFIDARLRELGVPSIDMGQTGDKMEELKDTFSSASKLSELVISTGGVSVGQKDLVPKALEELGADIIFHGVDIKPGMPATLATLNGTPILALSGNPFAAAVTFELLARPAIARLSSSPKLSPEQRQFVLSKTFTKRRACRRFQRGIAENGIVSVPDEQGNGQMRTMMGCNCLVELPAGEDAIEAGTPVTTYML